MNDLTQEDALKLLRKHAENEKQYEIVLKHSRAVQRVAMRIARNIYKQGHAVDLHLVRVASLLHDIGRFRHPPGKKSILHGVAGAKIMRSEGYEEIARICERHIGVGIRKQDITRQKLELPLKDYVPQTLEEKIITYADNLIAYDKEMDIGYVMERFRKEIGGDVVDRVKALHDEIIRMGGAT